MANEKELEAMDKVDEEPKPDAECDRLLRNAKRQVKQMMEEAVTRKFIHEESSSIISLCVAIDACLSHQLKRRALGLFKTNSSTALVQKVAKICPAAQEIMQMVETEERRQQEELKRQQQRAQQQLRQQEQDNSAAALLQSNSPNQQQQQQQQQWRVPPPSLPPRSPLKQVASNHSVHMRNLWIKCALLEKKLVPIVELLATEAHKYYEPEALMANPVSAQLLCSLLVGPSALEFSRSKTNDFYQFEEPSADELLKRHKLSNPIACLCNSHSHRDLSSHNNNNNNNSNYDNHLPRYNHRVVAAQQVGVARSWSNSTSGGRGEHRVPPPSTGAAHLARSATDSAEMRAASGEECPRSRASSASHSSAAAAANDSKQPSRTAALVRGPGSQRRRRPLALRTNLKTGALVTECHHYSCQEISEHQQTRGYSFRSASGASPCHRVESWPSTTCGGDQSTGEGRALPASTVSPLLASGAHLQNHLHHQVESGMRAPSGNQWPVWSPRMLHETLHQNARSSLLYAKNNILLETQAHGTMAGYLSLHHHTGSCDLILKWIPNQLINGGQSCSGSQQAASESGATCSCKPPAASETTCSSATKADEVDHAEQRQAGSENDGDNAPATTGVGGSYLDLVVNLSVSRIVLLHCHFNGLAMSSGDSNASAQTTTTTCGSESHVPDSNVSEQSDEMVQPVDSNPLADIEETLILVEADGVQRAPFKFPKGGLRWFLSCLETGLRPARFLEPALGPDEPLDGVGGDPLGPLRLLEHSSFWTPSGHLESPSAIAAAANNGTSAASRFDVLLRRLPSLKRNGRRQQADETTPAGSPFGSRVTSPSPSQATSDVQDPQQQQRPVRRAVNYVYRIVSVRQPDWPLQTPPLSALSVASSSSGGAGSLAVNGAARPAAPKSDSIIGGQIQQQQPSTCQNSSADSQNQGQSQKFRWSLSRLTNFSSRNGSSSSNSSALVFPSFGGGGKSTIDSVESLNADPRTQLEDDELAHGAQSGAMRRDSSSELIRIEAKLSDLKKSSTEELVAQLRDQSIASLCESMRKQILARAFYGWLAYCRRVKIVRTHLAELLVLANEQAQQQQQVDLDEEELAAGGGGGGSLTRERWQELMSEASLRELGESELRRRVCGLVYRGGVADDELRREVWPYLLGHHKLGDSLEVRTQRQRVARDAYDSARREWTKIERVIRQRDSELLAANMAKVARRQRREAAGARGDQPMAGASETTSGQESTCETDTQEDLLLEAEDDDGDGGEARLREDDKSDSQLAEDDHHITQGANERTSTTARVATTRVKRARARRRRRFRLESTGSLGSDASVTDQFGNNIHRIDKDVQRCDRNLWYFKEQANLDKLRNLMCSYVWQHLDVGYVQGMCDLAAPILVIFDSDELMAYECFSRLMLRMVANFPHGNAMDKHFEHLKYLMQVLDPKLFEMLQNNGDYTHFYFCYRWLLLDFKRELAYEDVYRVWETIWAARYVASEHFVVFLALALVRFYRDIIIENNMDFTDTIKFFNEMAERHDAEKIIALAQDCILELESLMC